MKYLLTALCILIFTGCSAAAPGAERLENSALRHNPVILNGGKEKTYQNLPDKKRGIFNMDAEERADIISDALTGLDGIKKAAVIVAGNSAIIGLTLTEPLDGEDLVRLKRRVDETAKQTDSGIERTAVSAAPDLYEKIIDLSGGDDENERADLQGIDDVGIFDDLIPSV
jgi:YhcN/YlaJ family sporulation lipoprotein